MNNPTTTRKTTPTYKGKASNPRDPRRAQEVLTVEELGVYIHSQQVDPWRGQIMQLGWEYCV